MIKDLEKLIEKAEERQKAISKETEELYVRHSLPIVIPSKIYGKQDDAVEAAKREILKRSGLVFELSNGNAGFSSTSEFVKISKKNKESTIVVDLPDNEKAELNFLFVSGNGSLPVNIVINAGKGSRLSIFEWYGSVGPGSATVSTHFVNAESESCIEVSMLHNENGRTIISSSLNAVADAGSLVRLNSIYKGGCITKALNFAESKGVGSMVALNEIVLGNEDQKFDLQTAIVNSGKDSNAELKSGAVLNGRSMCILKGYAKIAGCAEGSRSNIEERGLLLSEDSAISQLPDMSVECSYVASATHSASTSPIGSEQLFYLMSRGLSSEKARQAFTAGFIERYISGIDNSKVKDVANAIMGIKGLHEA